MSDVATEESASPDKSAPGHAAEAPPSRPSLTSFLSSERVVFWLLLLTFGSLVLPAVGVVIFSSFAPSTQTEVFGPLSVNAYRQLASEGHLSQVAWETFVFGGCSAVLALALGGTLAWLVVRTDARFKTLIYVCVFIQFAIPELIVIIGWRSLLGQGGIANYLLDRYLGGTHGLELDTMKGMIFVQTLQWAPLVFILLLGPFRTVPAALEEAAAVAGARRFIVYWRVTFPLLTPALLSVLILVIIRALRAFEVPLLIGTPAGVHVFTTQIFSAVQSQLYPNYGLAAAFGSVVLVVLVPLLFTYFRVTRMAAKYATVSGKGYRPTQISLSLRGKILTSGLFVLVFLLYLAPVLALAARSLWPRMGFNGTSDFFGDFSTDAYANLPDNVPDFARGLKNSFYIGFGTASVSVILVLAASWIVVRTRLRGRQSLDQLVSLPITIPSTVLGLAFLIIFLRLPIDVYGTLWVFFIAFLANYSPYAMRIIQPALSQVSGELEEAGKVSGARTLSVMRRVIAPLVAPSLAGAWIYVFFESFKDLPIAALLYTPGTPVVATQLLNLYTEGTSGTVAAYGTVIVLASVAFGGLGLLFMWRRGYKI